jgi:hypothetical protein
MKSCFRGHVICGGLDIIIHLPRHCTFLIIERELSDMFFHFGSFFELTILLQLFACLDPLLVSMVP